MDSLTIFHIYVKQNSHVTLIKEKNDTYLFCTGYPCAKCLALSVCLENEGLPLLTKNQVNNLIKNYPEYFI